MAGATVLTAASLLLLDLLLARAGLPGATAVSAVLAAAGWWRSSSACGRWRSPPPGAAGGRLCARPPAARPPTPPAVSFDRRGGPVRPARLDPAALRPLVAGPLALAAGAVELRTSHPIGG
ncbi:hypothetical protein NKH18_43965 [Streptomyces sp. M10(2022)]